MVPPLFFLPLGSCIAVCSKCFQFIYYSVLDSSDQSQSQLPETSSKSTKSVHNATSPQQFKDEDVAEEVVDKDTGVHILVRMCSNLLAYQIRQGDLCCRFLTMA